MEYDCDSGTGYRYRYRYRVFIKYGVFSLKSDFSELFQFCCSAGFLPAGVCTHTDKEGNREKPEAGIF